MILNRKNKFVIFSWRECLNVSILGKVVYCFEVMLRGRFLRVCFDIRMVGE